MRDSPAWLHWFRWALAFGCAFLLMAMPAALFRDNFDLVVVIRQSLPYLFLLIGPIVGLESGRHLRYRTTLVLAGSVGLISAISFAVDWLSRRGVSSLNVDRVVLASFVLSAFGFCLALVHVWRSSGFERVLWWGCVVVIPICLLITGTRTSLVLVVALAGVAGSKARGYVSWSRLGLVLVVLAGVLVFVLPGLAHLVVSDPEFLESRAKAAVSAIDSGGESDQSFRIRRGQYEAALAAIAEHPWVGHGVGFGSGQSFDTPLITPAKFGFLGTALILSYFVALGFATKRMPGRTDRLSILAAGRGTIFVLVALMPFGSVLEDKGFGVMLALFTAGAASAARGFSTGDQN